ncbi:hypothetical protein [Roseovarius sp. MMSF_3350]|uniref:hypothetical protein n=1 Tax=Roseovarius sp. MMSF_3350 TaxID=3046706 RepID=UPI00273F9852|nr:hypothetical protein [Roseovarius sp. MMSF_3350]
MMLDGGFISGIETVPVFERAAPCPFCAGHKGLCAAAVASLESEDGCQVDLWAVLCPCGCYGPLSEDSTDIEAALAAWNGRTAGQG